MNYLDPRYSDSIESSLRALYERVILFLPHVLAAIIVLVIGWVLGTFLGNIVNRVLAMIGIDSLANRLGLQQLANKTGRQFSIARLGQWVVKWFFFLTSIIAAAEILGLHQVTQFFFDDVLGYAAHVIVAMAILLLGMLAANFFGDIVESAVRAGGMKASATLASLTRWTIIVFAVIAALSELQIAEVFLQDLFRAVVAMLAIAGGIAFGMGGRDHAKKILDSVENGLGRRD